MKSFDDYKNFQACVNIARLEDTGRFVAEVCIRCTETGEVMEIVPELPLGVSPTRVTGNVGNTQIRFDIRPSIRQLPKGWDREQEWQELTALPGEER